MGRSIVFATRKDSRLMHPREVAERIEQLTAEQVEELRAFARAGQTADEFCKRTCDFLRAHTNSLPA